MPQGAIIGPFLLMAKISFILEIVRALLGTTLVHVLFAPSQIKIVQHRVDALPVGNK